MTIDRTDSPILRRARFRGDAAFAFALAFVVMTLLVPNVLTRLDPPSGDEPFYLMTATSLLKNHTLDETDVWADKDYENFYPSIDKRESPTFKGWYPPVDPLPPHPSKTKHPDMLISKHGLGLAVLVAPAYALGGRETVIHFLNLLAALLGANLFMLGWEVSGRRAAAWLVWLTFMFTTPVFCYAFLIFPELPAALFVVYAFRRARLAAHARLVGADAGAVNNAAQLAAVACCIGILPWLHGRFLPVAIALFLYVLIGGAVRHWRSVGQQVARLNTAGVVAAALILVALAALYLMYYIYFYGSPLPNTQDHAGFNDPLLTLFGLLGLVFDAQWGLLIYSPVYLVAMVGLVQLRRGYGVGRLAERLARGRSDLAWLLLIILPYYIIIANYKQWWGEWGPPARYLLSVVPLLAVPLAAALGVALESWRQWQVTVRTWWAEVTFWATYALLLFYSLLVSVGFQLDLQLMYNQPTGQSSLALQLSKWLHIGNPATNFATLFPGYVGLLFGYTEKTLLVPALAILGITIAVGTLIWASITTVHRATEHAPMG